MNDNLYYRCRSCNYKLFQNSIHGQENTCNSLFIEQPEWLKTGEENQFKLNCPKCKSKIGEVIYSGKKCNCMKWITPAIQIHKQKVDLFKNIPVNINY